MSKIGLTSGFEIPTEGKHIFKITEVTYDAQFGKMVIKMVNEDGCRHTERFQLLDDNSQPKEKAMNAFSYFAKTATHDYRNREIDTDELVGCYIGAEVTHDVQPNRNRPGSTITFANLGNYFEASAFEESSEPAPAPEPKPASTDFLASLGL